MKSKKIIIASGTTSKQKIDYIQELLSELKVNAVIEPVEVESGVSDQPITTTETKKGSVNRALSALKVSKEADISLGIEVGYHRRSGNKFEMFCWVTIVDRAGYRVSSQSHKFLLPEYHQNILDAGKPLGECLDGYSCKANDTMSKYLDEMIRYRKPFIVNALRDALLRYFKKEHF